MVWNINSQCPPNGETSPDVFDSNGAEAECCIWEAEPASNRQTSRACQISLMWDKIIMSPRTNLAATNRNWSFGKTWVSGRWVGAGTVEVAAGLTNTVTEMLTSFTPVSVWLPRVRPKFWAPVNLGQARGDLQGLWSLEGRLQLWHCAHQALKMHTCCSTQEYGKNVSAKKCTA